MRTDENRPVNFPVSTTRFPVGRIKPEAPFTVAIALLLFAMLPHRDATGGEAVSLQTVGDLGRHEALTFEGNKSFTKDQILAGLSSHFDFHLAARPSASLTNYTARLQRMILGGYHREGFPDAVVAVSSDAAAGRLWIKVNEGPRYLCGEVRLRGVQVSTNGAIPEWILNALCAKCYITSALYDAAKGISRADAPAGETQSDDQEGVWIKGSPAPFDAVARRSFTDRAADVLLAHGFHLSNIKVDVVRDLASHRADLVIDVETSGFRETIEEIEIAGLKKNSREQLLTYLNLKPGAEIQYELLADLRLRLWNSARFLKQEMTLQPLKQPGRFKLALDLLELEEAPTLAQDLTPEQKALLRFSDWLARPQSWPEDLSGDFEVRVGEIAMQGQIVLSDTGIALLLKQAPSNQPPTLAYAVLASPEVLGVYSLARKQKLVGSAGGRQVAFAASAKPTGRVKPEDMYDLTLAAGFSQEAGQQPFRCEINLAPVVCVHKLTEELACTLDHGVLTLARRTNESREDFQFEAKIDAATGRLISCVLSGSSTEGKGRINIHPEKGAFKRVEGDVVAASAKYPNAYAAEKPLSSALAFGAKDYLASPVPEWLMSSKLLSDRWRTPLAILQKVDLAELFEPIDPLWRVIASAPGTVEFEIPPDESSSRPPATVLAMFNRAMESADAGATKSPDTAKTVLGFATAALRVSDTLWEHRSWPWTILHEVVFVLMGNGDFTGAEINRLVQSDSLGPLGCWMCLQMVNHEDERLSETLAARGLARLTPADYEKDVQALLPDKSVAVQAIANGLNALGSLSEEDMLALTGVLPPDESAFLRQSVRSFREGRGKPLVMALGPVIEQRWDNVIRPRLAAAFHPYLESTADHAPTTPEGWFKRGQLLQAQAKSKEDLAAAGRCYQKAAEAAYPHAGCQLARLRVSEGVEVDRTRLSEWLEKDAERNCPAAQIMLGNLLVEPSGESNDLSWSKALPWFRKAAEQDQPEAQFMIGRAYSLGKGVPKDTAEASRSFRKAAEKDYEPAQHALARLYDQGDGVARYPMEALKWYRRAAENGCTAAQIELGERYRDGLDIARDDVEACAWFTLAAAHGDAFAKASLKSVEMKLTLQQVQEARDRASRYFPKRPATPSASR